MLPWNPNDRRSMDRAWCTNTPSQERCRTAPFRPMSATGSTRNAIAQGQASSPSTRFATQKVEATRTSSPTPISAQAGTDGEPRGPGAAQLKPSDQGSGTALYVAAQPGQAAALDSARFAPTAGAPFRVTFTARVAPQSKGSGYFDVVFLGASQELQRFRIPLEAATVSLGQGTTDRAGAYEIQTEKSLTSQVSIQVLYPGDETYWPASADVVLNGKLFSP